MLKEAQETQRRVAHGFPEAEDRDLWWPVGDGQWEIWPVAGSEYPLQVTEPWLLGSALTQLLSICRKVKATPGSQLPGSLSLRIWHPVSTVPFL